MATLTLRNTKGAPLTFQEIDNNFSNLDSDVSNIDVTSDIEGTVDSAYVDNLIPGLDAGSGGDDF